MIIMITIGFIQRFLKFKAYRFEVSVCLSGLHRGVCTWMTWWRKGCRLLYIFEKLVDYRREVAPIDWFITLSTRRDIIDENDQKLENISWCIFFGKNRFDCNWIDSLQYLFIWKYIFLLYIFILYRSLLN